MRKTLGEYWYYRTKGLAAFTVTSDNHMKKIKNQHATVYKFHDGSQFIVYKDFSKASSLIVRMN